MFYHADFDQFPEKIMAPMPNLDEYQQLMEDGKFNIREDAMGGNEIYTHPLLSKEQELHLFKQYNYLKYKNLPNEEVANHIVMANIYLIGFCIKKFNINVDFEEAVSNSYVTLRYIVDKFDWRKGYKFSTYATNSLRNRLNQIFYRSAFYNQTLVCFSNEIVKNHDMWKASEASKNADMVRFDDWEEIQEIYNSLDEESKYYLKLRFVDDLIRKEGGKVLKLSGQSFGQRYKAAISKIKRKYLVDKILHSFKKIKNFEKEKCHSWEDDFYKLVLGKLKEKNDRTGKISRVGVGTRGETNCQNS